MRLISSASSSPVKSGPRRNSNSPSPLVVEERAGQVGGQQVGRELGAREVEPERLGEAPRRQGLAEPREVLEQHVPLGEDRGQDQRERLALADDGLLDLVEHRPRPARSPGHGHLFAHSSSILRTHRSISARLSRRGWSVQDGGQVRSEQLLGARVAAAYAVSLLEAPVGQVGEPVAQGRLGDLRRQVALDGPEVGEKRGSCPGGVDQRSISTAQLWSSTPSPSTNSPTAATATTTSSASGTRWGSNSSTENTTYRTAVSSTAPPSRHQSPNALTASAGVCLQGCVDGVERGQGLEPVGLAELVVGEAGLPVERGQPGHRGRVGPDQLQHPEGELRGGLPRLDVARRRRRPGPRTCSRPPPRRCGASRPAGPRAGRRRRRPAARPPAAGEPRTSKSTSTGRRVGPAPRLPRLPGPLPTPVEQVGDADGEQQLDDEGDQAQQVVVARRALEHPLGVVDGGPVTGRLRRLGLAGRRPHRRRCRPRCSTPLGPIDAAQVTSSVIRSTPAATAATAVTDALLAPMAPNLPRDVGLMGHPGVTAATGQSTGENGSVPGTSRRPPMPAWAWA